MFYSNLELRVNYRRGWSDKIALSNRKAVHSTAKTTSLITEWKHSICTTAVR